MKLLLLLIFNLLLFGQSKGQVSETALVKKTFDSYKTAILNDKAEDAFKTIDSRTIKYYSDILTDVKNADSVKLNSMSLMDKMMVLIVRSKALKSEILAMRDNDLFIYAIKNGMVGKDGVSDNSIGDVTINTDFAKGQILVNGKKTPYYFHFYKEGGLWKLDITSLFSIANISFKKMIEDSGEAENDYIFMIIEAMEGRKPDSEIWKPIQ